MTERSIKDAIQAKKDRIEALKAKTRGKIPQKPTMSTEEILSEVMKQPEVPEKHLPDKPTIVLSLHTESGVAVILSTPKASTTSADVQVYIPRPREVTVAEEAPADASADAPAQVVEPDPAADESEFSRVSVEEVRKRAFNSHEFSDFFNKSTRIVERALHKPPSVSRSSEPIMRECSYKPIYSGNFCVGSLEWSDLYKDLLMASYIPHSNLGESPGTICLWSLALRSRPEFVLSSHSPATSVTFNRFDHNLIIGGTYSGQIIIWDLRNKAKPVQKTAMMAESHSHPVFCLSIVGSQFANTIVSGSTDGKVCVWSLNKLSQPNSFLDMKTKVKDIGCTTMVFPDNETNMFFMGAEDGSIIQSQLHGSKTGENETEIYSGHFGPITGLDLHKYRENYINDNINGLLLSSGVDWTVKLWNYKNAKTPLCSFEIYDDYVFDVKWNPAHPTKFACVDGAGYLDLWNLNRDIEHPEHRLQTGKHVLNKVNWANDGTMLATGNSMGEITVYSMREDYTTVRSDDLSRLEANLMLSTS